MRHSHRSAIATVELALCLPVILVLLAGLWEVGRLIEVQHVLWNSSREAARQAATGEDSLSLVASAAAIMLQKAEPTALVPAGTILVATTTSAANGEQSVRYTRGTATGAEVFTVTYRNLANSTVTDPRDASQMDKFELAISLPFQNVNWNPLAFIHVVSSERITAKVYWYCLRDLPVTINPDLPVD